MPYNEKIEYALSALHTMGIHQDPLPSESVLSKVAHRIKREILDTDKRYDPSPMMVSSVEPSSSPLWMAVLPRTTLMFHILAIHLRCTIFVFSSHAHPVVYRPAASRGTMIFFHALNAFRGHSEFHVLQVKTSLEQQHTSPSPMAPHTHAGSSSITAVSSTSPATLIGTTQEPQDPHLPLFPMRYTVREDAYESASRICLTQRKPKKNFRRSISWPGRLCLPLILQCTRHIDHGLNRRLTPLLSSFCCGHL